MNEQKHDKLEASNVRGFRDRGTAEIAATRAMIERIYNVYRLYGFGEVETPLIEFTKNLGKYLPDVDRPNAGVFSLQDENDEWLSLRYDLTAPLARFYAERYAELPKPFKSFRSGWVFRNEKVGPGRFRQFMQVDADIVGSDSRLCDAEIMIMTAHVMESLGLSKSQYAVRFSSRELIEGILLQAGIDLGDREVLQGIFRSIDKLDRLGLGEVEKLLRGGRRDQSGDTTAGVGLSGEVSRTILNFLEPAAAGERQSLADIRRNLHNDRALGAIDGLIELADLVAAAGFSDQNVVFDMSVVRGLEYYTGPVWEAELLFDTVNEQGEKAIYGSIGGGGRYDSMVNKFGAHLNGAACGVSIGVSRLYAALKALDRLPVNHDRPQVLVTVMDKQLTENYLRMTGELRKAGVRAELYTGTSGFRAQMKYADRVGHSLVIIQGSDEAARGCVQVKDMELGREKAAAISSNQEWRDTRPGQYEVSMSELVGELKKALNT